MMMWKLISDWQKYHKTFSQWKLLLLVCFGNSEKMGFLKTHFQESVFLEL